MYLPDVGFTPQTRNDMLVTSFNFFRTKGYAGSYEEFSISNTATWLDANLFPLLDRYQDQLVSILHNIWSTLHNMYGTIEQGCGSALNPFVRELTKLCDGVFVSIPNYDPALSAGTIGLYLDNVIKNSARDMQQLEATLANIAWPGMVSMVSSGAPQTEFSQTFTANVGFINGQFFTYNFYNLHPNDYTFIHIRINLVYKVGAVRYEDSQIISHVSHKLHSDLQIGKHLYVDSFLHHEHFPNLASMQLAWSTDGSIWSNTNYHSANWQRLQASTVTIGAID